MHRGAIQARWDRGALQLRQLLLLLLLLMLAVKQVITLRLGLPVRFLMPDMMVLVVFNVHIFLIMVVVLGFGGEPAAVEPT
jgi:hypothetical protein